MRLLYNICFWLFFLLSSPYYFLRLWRRGNWKKGFGQRFGKYDTKFKQSITNRQVIWFHAVSVGEMNVCVHLIKALSPRLPNVKMVVSTTTTTAMGELQKRLPPSVGKIYYPIDGRKWVSRAVTLVDPDAVILMESEIWPNFIWRTRSTGVPLFLANARVSDRSYPRYLRFGALFRDLFSTFQAVGAQNETDAERLRNLGCHPEAVRVVGNLKFDAAAPSSQSSLDVGPFLTQIGVTTDSSILVGGSTHDGEELMLAEQFVRLRKRFPYLFLVLVPRHFERANDIMRDLRKLGLRCCFRSEIKSDSHFEADSLDCLLVNTTGELVSFYRHATVVFVGKSLTAQGGQNPIEPAALGKATVVGPHMRNFADVVRILISGQGLLQVKDATELESVMADLLANPARREELGRNAERIVRANQGAVDRTVEMLLENLRGRELYIAPASKT